MKIILVLILCSATSNTCMPAYEWPKTFDTTYECMIAGYTEARKKTQKLGFKAVNTYKLYINFICAPSNPTGNDV